MNVAENWILFVCNNDNQVNVLTPVARLLALRGREVRFLSLDSYYAQGASEALKRTEFQYVELPTQICKGRFYSDPLERQGFVLDAAIAVEEFFSSQRPAAVVLGHDVELVEQLIVRAAERKGIRTARIQDGIQGSVPPARLQDFDPSRLPFDGGCELLMVWNETLKQGLIERGIRGDIVVAGNPRMDAAFQLEPKTRTRPPYRVLLAGQCWTTHLQMTLALELAFYERLISQFLSREDTEVIFKLHPAQLYPEVYEELPKRFGNRLSIVREGDSLDLIREVDVVATVTSTVGLEALQLGVPIIRLNYLISESSEEFLAGEQEFLEQLHSEGFPNALSFSGIDAETCLATYGSAVDGQCSARAADSIEGLISDAFSAAPVEPKVSVLMVHSKGETLGSVCSVLRPSQFPIEVVLVDTSPDSALKAAVEQELNDPRVRVYTAPGMSEASALNLGLSHCRAEIVARLGEDCIALPGWTDELYRALAESPEANIAVCAFKMRDQGGLINQTHNLPEELTPREFAGMMTAPITMLGYGLRKARAPRLSEQDSNVEGNLFAATVGDLDDPRRLCCLTAPLFLTPFNPSVYEHARYGHGYRVPQFLKGKGEKKHETTEMPLRDDLSRTRATLVCLEADSSTIENLRRLECQTDVELEVLIVPREKNTLRQDELESLIQAQKVKLLEDLTGRGPSEQLSRVLARASGELMIVLGNGLVPLRSDFISQHLAAHRTSPQTLVIGGSTMTGGAAEDFLSSVCSKMGYFTGFIGAQEPGIGLDLNHFSVAPELLSKESVRPDGRHQTMWGEMAWLGNNVEEAGGGVSFHPELQAGYIAPIQLVDWLREMVGRSEDMVRLINRNPLFMERLLGMTAVTLTNLEEWDKRVREDAKEISGGVEQVVAFIEEIRGNSAASSPELEPVLAEVLQSIYEHFQRRTLVRKYLQVEDLAPIGFAGQLL